MIINKVRKKKDLPIIWVSTGKPFEEFGQKKHLQPRPNNPVKHTAPKGNYS